MPSLRALRGQPLTRLPWGRQSLTLYRQDAGLALACALGTLVLFNLPWHWLGAAVGEFVPLLIAAVGFYLAAALIGSLGAPGQDSADRWL